MPGLSISSQTITGVTAVTKMTGEVKAVDFDLVEDEFNKILGSGVLGLVLEISGLDDLSSACLGAFVNMARALADRKGRLVIAAPRPKILGLIEMLGLSESLTIADTPEQARKLISSIR